jgi:hypothetical protein
MIDEPIYSADWQVNEASTAQRMPVACRQFFLAFVLLRLLGNARVAAGNAGIIIGNANRGSCSAKPLDLRVVRALSGQQDMATVPAPPRHSSQKKMLPATRHRSECAAGKNDFAKQSW